MRSILTLAKEEKEKLIVSIKVLKKNLDFFVIRFYHYLLKTDAGILFQTTDKDKQYHMFAVSLNIIFSHIDNPNQVSDYIDDLIVNHRNYGVLNEHVDYFRDSFMNALQEVFNEELDIEIYDLWLKLISDILKYFQTNNEL